jgi:hypothetical protein
MEYPLENTIQAQFNTLINFIQKLLLLFLGFWLINVIFVASHEAGHGIAAIASGSKIYGLYVSPLGIEGSITHTTITDPLLCNIVLFSGILATTLMTLIGYLMKYDLAVYLLSIRTIECAINFTPGSDMYSLLLSLGPAIVLLVVAVVGINTLSAGTMFYRFLGKYESAIARDGGYKALNEAIHASVISTPYIEAKK